MRDLLAIITTERQSLLKGLSISFLIIFPFTFLPTIVEHGLSVSAFAGRFNQSILYSVGFALLVVCTSIIHNYNGLVNRKSYFGRPAFKALDFYGRIDGKGSIVHDLETILLGKVSSYFFRLNLLEIEKINPILEIVPLIDLKGKENEIETLKMEYNFKTDFFLGMSVRLKDIDLEDVNAIRILLIDLEKVLEVMEFERLEIDESELKMDLRD